MGLELLAKSTAGGATCIVRGGALASKLPTSTAVMLSLLFAGSASADTTTGTVPLPAEIAQQRESVCDSTLRAALQASGAADAEVEGFSNCFDQLAAELVVELDGQSSSAKRARKIVRYLHERLLTGGYDANCCDLRVAFEEGRFNCVGSSILFFALAKRCGLEIRPVLAAGHVWCRVTDRTGDFDVETTRNVPSMSEQRSTLATDVRELDAQGLIALVYYNRSVAELHANHFAEAVAAAREALRLDPSSSLARNNLAAAYNNWAVSCAEANDQARALELVRAAHGLAPHDARVKANAERLYHRAFGVTDKPSGGSIGGDGAAEQRPAR